MEVIVLAGGLGTRLQGVIGEYPKCMAEVAGRPFLAHVFDYLAQQRCVQAILSLGYKHEIVTEWVEKQDLPFVVDYVIEKEPRGTGGGLMLAMQQASADNVVVVNGDTLFTVNLERMMHYHLTQHSCTTLALKKMYSFDRYGVVNTNDGGVITSFEEKTYKEAGMINGGVYIVNQKHIHSKHLPIKCSMEKDYLEKYTAEGKFYGFESDGYFIDIGVPADYERAQEDLKTMAS
ncbi:MAG: nucleotidyltransferase family protein [Taibaiella sp.]|nr:nucleotidyltransferase family protein [Taibaiella sp.]